MWLILIIQEQNGEYMVKRALLMTLVLIVAILLCRAAMAADDLDSIEGTLWMEIFPGKYLFGFYDENIYLGVQGSISLRDRCSKKGISCAEVMQIT